MKRISLLLIIIGCMGIASLLLVITGNDQRSIGTRPLTQATVPMPPETVAQAAESPAEPPSKAASIPDQKPSRPPFSARARIEALLATGDAADALIARAIESGLADFATVPGILSEMFKGKELDERTADVLIAVLGEDLAQLGAGLKYIGSATLKDDVMRMAIAMWIDRDPKLLVETFRTQLTDYTRTKMLGSVARALCKQGNIALASEVIGDLPKGKERMDVIRELAGLRGKEEGLSAIQWAKSLEEADERSSAEFEIAQELGHKLTPDELVTAMNEFVDPRARSQCAFWAARRLMETDVESAIQWAGQLPDDVRPGVQSSVAGKLAHDDLARATNFALNCPTGSKDAGLSSILNVILDQEPRSAGKWVSNLPADIQGTFASIVGVKWYRAEPDTAISWASALPAGKTRDMAFLGMANGAGKDKEAKVWLANQIGDETIRRKFLQFVR